MLNHLHWTVPPAYPKADVDRTTVELAERAFVACARELAVRVYEGLDAGRAWLAVRHLAHPAATPATWHELCARVGAGLSLAYGALDPVDVAPDLISGFDLERQRSIAGEVLEARVAWAAYWMLRGPDAIPCVHCFHDLSRTVATWQPLHDCAVHGTGA